MTTSPVSRRVPLVVICRIVASIGPWRTRGPRSSINFNDGFLGATDVFFEKALLTVQLGIIAMSLVLGLLVLAVRLNLGLVPVGPS
jgi:hypothetical protein